MDPKTTKKILNLIKEQQNEIMQESNETAAGKPIGRMSLPNKDFDEDEEDEDQGQDDEQDYEDWDGHGVDNLVRLISNKPTYRILTKTMTN